MYQNNTDDRTPILPKIPDWEVFIVNLYPALETKDSSVLKDKDKIEDRINDIRFHDRSKYDQKVAHLVADYVDLTRRLIKLARGTGKVNHKEIEASLKVAGESTKCDVKEKRNLMDLVLIKFRVKFIALIERMIRTLFLARQVTLLLLHWTNYIGRGRGIQMNGSRINTKSGRLITEYFFIISSRPLIRYSYFIR
jgi:hypothetical protein